MKTPRILRNSIATLLSLAAAAHAVPLTWDTQPGSVGVGDGFITGGAGTWNLTNGNWTPDFGANNVAWVNNIVPDDAVFGGTGGEVVLGTGITVGNITFDGNGYNLTCNPLTFGSATSTVTANGVFGTITSSIAGVNGVTFEGTGTAGTYIDGNNTYTGVTSVNSAFLVVRNAGSLGSSVDGTVVADGATLQVENGGAGNVHIANEAVTISGTGTLGNRGALASWTGNNTWGGSVTMVADSSIFIQSGNLSVNSVVSGVGINLSKTGGGQLTFGGSSSNTYDQVTTVDTGTLVLAKTGGTKAIIGAVLMGAGNTSQPNLRMAANEQFGPGVLMTFVNDPGNWTRFDLQGTTQTLAGLDGATGGGVVQNERLGGGGTNGPATLKIENNLGPQFYNGYLRDRDGGAGTWLLNLIKTGPDTQTLAGNNVNYTGTTTVGEGTLELQQTLNYASPTTVASGATFEINGTGPNFQNNQVGARIALAGTLNRTGAAGWMVWNGKLSPTAGGATLNLRNDGADPGSGVGWLFLDGGLGASGAQTLAINHTFSDGVLPNNNLSTVLRNNNSTYTGGLTVTNGSLVIGGGGGVTGTQLANADVTLNSATLEFASVFASNQNTANQLKSVSGTGTVSIGGSALSVGFNDGSGAFSGSVIGSGSITKVGSGTQTLSSANSYTGGTTVNAGTLRLDYGTEDNNKLSDTAALTLGGGTLDLSGGSHTEIVASTILAAGTASSVTRTSGAAVLQMNAITRNAGAAISFGASGIATTDTLNNAGGILGTWATVGSDWAFNSTNGVGGPINAYSAYTNVDRLGGAIADGSANNVKIIENGGGVGVTLAAGGTTTINSLLQGAGPGTAAVDIGASNTLRLGAAGGVFLPSGSSALTLDNGTLTAGGADNTAGSVEVNNASTANGITINSLIADNGTGAVTLTKLGAGALTVTNTNIHTGGTTVSAGTLAFNSGSLGTTGAITVAGGTLRWNGSNTEDVSARTTLVNGLTATFDTNGNDVTFASAIGNGTSGAVVKAGNGKLILFTASTRTGSTTVSGGTLALNNVNALQSSTLDTGTSGAQAVTFDVAGINTYNLGGLQGADALDIGGNTISVGGGNTATNYSGVLSGAAGSLTKVGTGSLTLSGASSNNYTGASTFASNGQLILAKTGGAVAIPGDLIMAAPSTRGIVSTAEDNQFASGSVLRFTTAGDTRLELKGTTQTLGGIENSAVAVKTFHAIQHSEFGSPAAVDSTSQLILDVSVGNSFTFNTTNGALRDYTGGTVSLVKNGDGTQILSAGGVTYTGTTAVNAGTLTLLNANGYASPTTVGNNATVILSNTVNMGMGSGAAFTLNTGGTLVHNGQTNGGDYLTLAGGFTVSGSTTINQNSVTNTTGANKNLFLDGGLHGSGTVTITAANPGNAVTLRNNNSTFAGTMIVNGIASTTVNAGSGIAVGGTTTALENADITLNGTMELLNQGLGWAGSAPGDFAMGALNGSGVMVANFTGGGETRVKIGNTNNNGNFSGVIADGTGNRVVLTKLGTATQTLSGNNTYSGITTIVGGTLQIGNGGTSGAIGNGAIVNNGALVFDRSNASTTTGAISGTGGVTKNGAGELTLTNNSTYKGATVINAGKIKLGASQTLPFASAIQLDATDGVSIVTSGGGVVTNWLNNTGATFGVAGDTIAAAGQEPTFIAAEPAMNNKPVIRFDAATPNGIAPFDRLTNGLDFTTGNVTIMYAGRLNGGANQRLLAAVNNNWLLGTWGTADNLGGGSERAYFGANWVYEGTGFDTNTRIYTGTIATGGAAKFYVNGADRGSGAGAQGPNGLSLGGGYNGNPVTEYSSGDIGEMLVFNSVLTSEERGAVEAYLNRKWRSGATNVLPTTGAVAITAAGATLCVNGITQTIGALTGVVGSSIELNDGSLTAGDATDTIFAGDIVGPGDFTKAGSGKLKISGALSMTTLTADEGTLNVASNAAGADVIVNAVANFGVSQTLDSLTINDGGVATLGALLESPGALAEFAGGEIGGDALAGAASVAAVPEPGSAALLFGGMLTLLGLRRRKQGAVGCD